VACGTMLRGPDLLANLRDAAGIVYNSTGLLTCFDLYNLYVECADPTGCGQGFDSLAWDYQACTEVELCFETNNVTDMFPPMAFTEKDREVYCSKRWAVVPRPGWLKVQFWGEGKFQILLDPPTPPVTTGVGGAVLYLLMNSCVQPSLQRATSFSPTGTWTHGPMEGCASP
ncbi:hypothetical protein XENORESO_016005, partial [Xenotaenia resolanae]